MMTYTKGPWRAERNASFSYTINTDYAHDRGHDCNVVREVRCEANANLIAAAPELLEALKNLMTFVPDSSAPDTKLSLCRAAAVNAVHKAEGR